MRSTEEIERVVETCSDSLLRLAMHHVQNIAEAQDIVQDVMVKYMHETAVFKTAEHEKAWLLRVTVNRCKDYHRHWWQRSRSDMPEQIPVVSKDRYPILDEVRLLPFHERNAIYLYYFEEMSIKEIAEILQSKEGTVSSWLTRGRKRLREQLKGEWNDDIL